MTFHNRDTRSKKLQVNFSIDWQRWGKAEVKIFDIIVTYVNYVSVIKLHMYLAKQLLCYTIDEF